VNRIEDRGLWIESATSLSATGPWAVSLRLVQSVMDGGIADLGAVPPRLAANLPTIRDIYASWISGSSRPQLSFETSSIPGTAGKGTSAFFSGGVDSLYTLIQHRDEIDNLIFVHGFDIPLADAAVFARTEIKLREVAEIFGKPLILVRTNMHWDRPRLPCNWGMYCGAAMAAVAHALAPNHNKVFIAPSRSYPDLYPWGSHPLLDPLWSTETLEIDHDGGELRIEKLRAIIQYPEALDRLRVCWEYPGKFNCGICEKCIRTMLGLRVLGVERCDAFPDTLHPSNVRAMQLSRDTVMLWRELLRPSLPSGLTAAVQSAIHSYESGLPPRTGKPTQEIKRWMYAAHNAWRALISPI
jgi:hypothetical protein